MAQRNELVIRGNAVGLTASNYPNDSKFEQKILYLEKNGTTYTETLGSGTFTIAGADVAAADTMTIGNRTYTFRATALTGAKAVSTLTNAVSFTAGETFTIDGRTYTMQTSPAKANDIAIGASVAISLDNIKQAINQGDTAYPSAPTNEGSGTNWHADTVRHHSVVATTNAATTQKIEAEEYGTAANSFVTSETCANGSWTSTVMAGGVANVADEILIQASAAATLDVIKDAVNATTVTGVVGTDYSYGTTVHNQVTATTNAATTQLFRARQGAFDNASIATTTTGGGNCVFGGTIMASGVRGVIARGTTGTSAGVISSPEVGGISGEANLV